MNRSIWCKYRLLRWCILPVLMFFLTGCGAHNRSSLRWVTYSETGAPLDVKEVIAAANAVSEEKIGVTVDLEFQPTEKINLMMASGEYYDIVFTCSWVNDFDKNAEAGLYYDITDLVQKETPALYQSIGKYWDCAKIDGRIMGIPILKNMDAQNMFRLNADYFEGQKGMEIPEEMDGFEALEPFLKVYKEDYPTKYPIAMDKGGPPGYMNFVEQIAGGIIVIPYDQETEIPQAMALWDCEKVMDRYRTLHRWYKAGYIHPDAATIDSTAADKSFPVRFGVAWKGYMGYSNPADWGFHVKTPTYEGPFISRQSEQGAMFAICGACSEERVIKCLKYIELLSTDRKFRDILADPDQWEKVFEEYDTEGIYSKTHGFHYRESRKESIVAALQAIFGDYSTELRTGTSDPDVVIPKMRARMEAAGFDELLADVQDQINEWFASGH